MPKLHPRSPRSSNRRRSLQGRTATRSRTAPVAGRGGPGSRDHRRRLDRRAHLAVGRPALAAVPQGPARDQLVLHARLGDVVRVPQPGGHRRLPGDVLPAGCQRRRLRVDPLHHRQRVPRPVRARHAQVGRVGDDHPDLPAHGARVLLRRLQVPARADLDHRRRAADPDAGDGLHRLPAAVRPAVLLGDDRRRQHQRHRPVHRPVPVGLPASRARVRRDDAVALLRDPHAADPGADRRADRRPPVPDHEARHLRAALDQGRAGARARDWRESRV